jgi:hypothetical protein
LLDAKLALYQQLAVRPERVEQVDVVLCESRDTVMLYCWLATTCDDDLLLASFDHPTDRPFDPAPVEAEVLRFLRQRLN